jgi:hypothetical protein
MADRSRGVPAGIWRLLLELLEERDTEKAELRATVTVGLDRFEESACRRLVTRAETAVAGQRSRQLVSAM